MMMRDYILGAAAGLMLATGAASAATTTVVVNADDDSETTNEFISFSGPGTGGGTVFTFDLNDFANGTGDFASVAGLDLVSLTLAGQFGTFGSDPTSTTFTPSAEVGEVAIEDATVDLNISCDAACQTATDPDPEALFSAEISGQSTLDTILDGSQTLVVTYRRSMPTMTGEVIFDNLRLVFEYEHGPGTVIPLPASGVLLLGGLAALGFARRRTGADKA